MKQAIIPDTCLDPLRGTWHRVRRLVFPPGGGYFFNREFRKFLKRSPGQPLEREELEKLVSFWNNGASADSTLLRLLPPFVERCNSQILECGSGLSTLFLGYYAGVLGKKVTTFEDSSLWADKIEAQLELHGLDSVHIERKPLVNYGEFEWYQLPDKMPGEFSLVICDGPLGSTRGGRSGFIHLLENKLTPDCTVILDDAERYREQQLASLLVSRLKATIKIYGESKKVAVIAKNNEFLPLGTGQKERVPSPKSQG